MKKNQPIKILSALFGCVLLLSACAGPDRPYTMAKNQPPPTSRNSGGATADETLGPCTPKIKGVTLKLTAATSSGIKESDAKEIPDVIVRFASTGDVTMKSTDFPASDITLSGVTLHVSLTNEVRGHYTATPALISLDDLVFQVSGFINGTLPPLSLTTGHIDQSGNAGTLSKDGSLNPEDKTITLVGGAPIPQSLAPSGFEFLGGAALVVEISGTLESIPDITTCSATGSGGGVQFKNVITETENGNTVERERPVTGTLDFGRIFVPEQGVDLNTDLNEKFTQERRLRVRVPEGKPAVDATIANSAGYTISPNGNIHIASGGQQEFRIRFSMPAVPYTSSSPAASTDAKLDLNFGDSKLTLSGVVKRAAPEMVMKSPSSTTIDLGDVITPIRQEGSGTRIICGNNRAFAQQKVILKNTGVRELQITRIVQPGPVTADARPERPDLGCQNFGTNGTEFAAMGLRWSNGATCAAGPAPGTLTGACRIPVGEGEVSFKVIYLPINASNITNGQSGHLVSDQAKLSVESNDPKYSTGFNLSFSGKISPDQSDVLKIRRGGGARFETDKGGVVKIVGTSTSNEPTELVLVNKLNQELQIADIRIPAASGFEVLNTSDKPKPTRVPASNSSGEPGTASFWVRLNPPSASSNRKVFNAPLDILFAGGSTGQQSKFSINLVGTFNLQPLEGCVEITADKVNSYIDNSLGNVNQDTVDSLDYRIKGRNVKPGALRFQFTPIPNTSLSEVVLQPALGLKPTQNGALARSIKSLTLTDRAKLFRIYTTRMSGLINVGYHQDGDASNDALGGGDGDPDCTEPQGPIVGSYPDSGPHNCSYFYYIIANKESAPDHPIVGFYDNATGHIVLPLEMRFVNPYHTDPGGYDRSWESVIDLKATLSTFDIRSLTLNTEEIFGEHLRETELVTSPTIGTNEVSIPNDPQGFGHVLADTDFQKCPEIPGEGGQMIHWSPLDFRFDPHSVRDQGLETKLLCNLTDSAPYYLKGMPITPRQAENGDIDYKLVMTLLTRYGPMGEAARLPDGYPQGIPQFLANSRMWIALQGTMKQCSAGTTGTGSTGSMTGTGSRH